MPAAQFAKVQQRIVSKKAVWQLFGAIGAYPVQELDQAESGTKQALLSVIDQLKEQQNVLAHCELNEPHRVANERRTERSLEHEQVRAA